MHVNQFFHGNTPLESWPTGEASRSRPTPPITAKRFLVCPVQHASQCSLIGYKTAEKLTLAVSPHAVTSHMSWPVSQQESNSDEPALHWIVTYTSFVSNA